MSVNTTTAPVTPGTQPHAVRRGLSIATRWIVLVGILVVWQVSTMLMDNPFFPTPVKIVQKAAVLWLPGPDGLLTRSMRLDVLPSIARALTGFGLAIVAGVALGTAIALSRRLEGFLDWILQFMRAVPPPTLFPVFLILLGTTDQMRIALIAFGSVWPILLNTIEGVRGVRPLTIETSRVFRISPARRLFEVILPSAGPKILAGVRTSLSLALILMVISEMIASSSGIGHQLVQAQRSFAITNMWAGILLLAILGYLFNLILTLVERRILAWQRESGRETS
ncbi:ABC-type nitrate/sulfonate/bicarbonate transport system, permease component [Raineyella antarctica]|uniref:ABC-type nitrate/sulfonate/bicarbonate transport system, permease component n=1 Tax=Raineyella antarctica TaxID=1577474 RepID=A0A1G6GHR7_9ACTN|nr:ABC transporter permease [Raineyella antarctica]SDB81295.1 ABC-type nitrate/sulfonate/bicarbonate transport system, permease component [Raineyella antarctica]